MLIFSAENNRCEGHEKNPHSRWCFGSVRSCGFGLSNHSHRHHPRRQRPELAAGTVLVPPCPTTLSFSLQVLLNDHTTLTINKSTFSGNSFTDHASYSDPDVCQL